MKKGIRWIPVALIVLFLPVVILVPLSGAQGTKISTGAHSLPRVVGSAMVPQGNGVFVGISYHNDTSPPLRDMKPAPLESAPSARRTKTRNCPTITWMLQTERSCRTSTSPRRTCPPRS